MPHEQSPTTTPEAPQKSTLDFEPLDNDPAVFEAFAEMLAARERADAAASDPKDAAPVNMKSVEASNAFKLHQAEAWDLIASTLNIVDGSSSSASATLTDVANFLATGVEHYTTEDPQRNAADLYREAQGKFGYMLQNPEYIRSDVANEHNN